MNQNEFIINEKASRDTIDVKRAYVKMSGDHATGVLLSQIVYWHLPDKEGNPTKMRVKKNGELWIAKKRDDWWDEICMLPKQFDRAIKELENRQLVKTQLFRFGGSPTKHIRLNWDVFLKVYNATINDINPFFDSKSPRGGKWIFPNRVNPNSRIGNMEIDERGKSETPPKPTPAVAPTLAEKGHRLLTKTTTENHHPAANFSETEVTHTDDDDCGKNVDDLKNQKKLNNQPNRSKALKSKTLDGLSKYLLQAGEALEKHGITEDNDIKKWNERNVPLLRKWFDAGIPAECVVAGIETTMSRHNGKVTSVKFFENEVQKAYEAHQAHQKVKSDAQVSVDQTSTLLARLKKARES